MNTPLRGRFEGGAGETGTPRVFGAFCSKKYIVCFCVKRTIKHPSRVRGKDVAV